MTPKFKLSLKKPVHLFFVSAVVAALAGVVATLITLAVVERTQTNQKRIKDFYLTETAVHVSPHHIRKAMDKGDSSFILVDLRSQEEYEREHIVGAISIPAYKDPDTSAYDDVERIVGEFRKLPKDKDIIVYCYSIPCMTGKKVGAMLAEHDIYVKHLGVGWNEWRYFWNQWNHEHEWDKVKVEDYVVSGPESGTPEIKIDSETCPVEGELGC